MAADPTPLHPRTLGAAVLTVAATYIYFLIFAQFGFLQSAQAALGSGADTVHPLMGAMGLAGILASAGAAFRFDLASARWRLTWGFAGCACAAAGALLAHNQAGFLAVAAFTGFGAGFTTVTLAAMLRAAVGLRQLGLILGLGTGLAYAFCNLPGIFAADPRLQAGLALGAAVLGAIAGWQLPPRFPAGPETTGDYSRGGSARWVAIFLGLVCLDSALFYFIQHEPALRADLWEGAHRELLNAGTHLVGAVLAGWALDRGRLGTAVGVAGLTIIAAAIWFTTGHPGDEGVGRAYMAGVSAYSTAIVFYPAQSGRAGLAALVYAVAGWGGSALGIGLAENGGRLSPMLAFVAAGVLAICFTVRHFASRLPR
jgi:cytochrome c oxidase cbb3-type subunit 2